MVTLREANGETLHDTELGADFLDLTEAKATEAKAGTWDHIKLNFSASAKGHTPQGKKAADGTGENTCKPHVAPVYPEHTHSSYR